MVGILVAPGQALAAPTGLSPNDPNAAPGPTFGTPMNNVELSWSDIGASSYQVQVSDSNGNYWPTPSVDIKTSATRYSLPANLPRNDYRWRVQAVGSDDWSQDAWFSLGWTAAPDNAEIIGDDSRGPVFTWDAIPDASYYEVQLSTRPYRGDDDAGEPVDPEHPDRSVCHTSATVFSPYWTREGDVEGIIPDETTNICEEYSGGPYYWRVRGRDGVFDPRQPVVTPNSIDCSGVSYHHSPAEFPQKARCSAWGYPADPNYVTTPIVGPGFPGDIVNNTVDIGPRTGAMGQHVGLTNTPVISWNHVPNATFYRVYVSNSPDHASQESWWETQGNHFSPIKQMADKNKKMYYSVVACRLDEMPEEVIEDDPNTPGDESEVNALLVSEYVKDPTAVINCSTRTPSRSFTKITPNRVDDVTTQQSGPNTVLTWSTLQDASKPSGSPQVAVAEAAGYQVQVSGQFGDFANPSMNVRVDRLGNVADRSHLTVETIALPDGWTWRVRPWDETGSYEYPWSSAPPQSPAVPTVSMATTDGFGHGASLRVRFSEPVTNVNNGSLRVVAASTGDPVAGTKVQRVTGTLYDVRPDKNWVPSEQYSLRLDNAVRSAETGLQVRVDQSGTVRSSRNVDSTSPAIGKRKGDSKWKTVRASGAIGKSYVMTAPKKKTKNPSWVQVTVRSSRVTVHACESPKSGKAQILVDGKKVKTVDLYRKSTKCGAVAGFDVAGGDQHRIRFQPTGTKNKRSSGRAVRFDGIKLR